MTAPRYERDCAVGACALFVLLNLSFFPFLWGNASLQDSVQSPSLYATGSRSPAALQRAFPRVIDYGAAAWASEPWYALEHGLVVVDREPPLWNPYSGYGQPLAANMQSQPYSPFAWIAIVSDSPRGYAWYVVARLYAAALFALLFLRLFVPMLPAAIGATVAAYLGFYWLFVTLPELSTETLGFATLYAVELLLRAPTAPRALALASVLALDVVGGMPEACLLVVLFVALYAASRWAASSAIRVRTARLVGYGLAAALLAGGLSAVQLIPFAEYVPVSSNVHAGRGATSVPGLQADPITSGSLALYVAPLAHGPNAILSKRQPYSELRNFYGAAALLLALIGGASALAAVGRRARDGFPALFFTLVAVVLALKRFGYGPLQAIAGLPGLRLVLFTKYDEAIAGLCVAALAAYGAATLAEAPSRAIVAGAAATIAAVLASFWLAQVRDVARAGDLQFYVWYAVAVASSALACAAIVAFARCGRRISGRATALFFVVAVPLEAHLNFIVPMYYAAGQTTTVAASPRAGAPYLNFVRTGLRNGERFFGEDSVLFPNWSAAFGIPDPRALDAMYDGRYLTFVRTFVPKGRDDDLTDRFGGLARMRFRSERQRRFLELSSVRFVGVAGDRTLDGAGLSRAYRDGSVTIYRFRDTLPRASLFRHVVIARSESDALRVLTAPSFDPHRDVAIEDPDAAVATLGGATPEAVRAATIRTYGSRAVDIRTTVARTSVLVLNDTYFPGWTADIDGRPTRIYRADDLFRGILVPPGTHDVAFRYEPQSFRIGMHVTEWSLAIVCLLLLAIAWRALARRRIVLGVRAARAGAAS